MRGLLRRAGFTEVALSDVRRPMHYSSDPDAAQRFVLEVFGWALRDLSICVRDYKALPPYARQLVDHMREERREIT